MTIRENDANTLLRVNQLNVIYENRRGMVHAVKDASFEMGSGRVLCIVGESGSGKSAIALSLLKLIDPPGKITNGQVLLDGEDLLSLSEQQLTRIRGKQMGMIFQNPSRSLNPVIKIGVQCAETIRSHEKLSRVEADERTLDCLREVGFARPQETMNRFPYQLSGGMLQRVMIAMALSLKPRLLIADEPTTALDVTVQAQVMSRLLQLKKRWNTSILLITHDLSIAAQMADEVAVIHAGIIVEHRKTLDLFQDPHHPYTKKLLRNVRGESNKEMTYEWNCCK
ncbi:ABC transporter ATP-binding protein [Paenibacillus profundus]|uniref:ABC transporter ATP-binding protein n=1 Tax=Paenibacillus profundus TaxID=1173085 RepID=A0ABS8YHG1_9BACL|nr:ABC transporter ATP-binding protein [Paenibacillus profundus]MCE5169800.1 ABC transporter ATP-binding protein [Paenibacillus profundus]